MEKSHYQILGVLRNATPDNIKAAYRKLAAQFHPDRNPSTAAHVRFNEIAVAYAVLSDQEQREAYDKELANALIENPMQKARELSSQYFSYIQQP